MKILKIFGIVVGIHVFALILIFANPGCSSSTKPAPVPSDTVAATPPPSISLPTTPSAAPAPSSAPVAFNPDAPATSSTASSTASVRYTPTRPGTPAATTLVTEPVADVTPATTYTVKAGDVLWNVAKKYNVTVAQLTAANNLKANAVLKPGQKLLIPGKPASPAVAATTAPTSAPPQPKVTEAASTRPANIPAQSGQGPVKHVVKPGESLGVIARTYGVPLREIALANNITDPAKVKAGAELIIPGWDPAPTKSGKSGSTKSAGATPPAPAPKSAPVSPPTVNVEGTPAATAPPVIDLERSSPIMPAPKGP